MSSKLPAHVLYEFCGSLDQVSQLNFPSLIKATYILHLSHYRMAVHWFIGHLLPHRYSCKTDSIDIPLLGNVEGCRIVCMTRKLEEFPDADCDDTECLSSILRSFKNLLLLFLEDPEKYLVYLSCRAEFQSAYKHRHKNKHHVCHTLTTCPAPKILLPDLWNVSNFPQRFNEIDHSAGISGHGSITMAAKMSMANY